MADEVDPDAEAEYDPANYGPGAPTIVGDPAYADAIAWDPGGKSGTYITADQVDSLGAPGPNGNWTITDLDQNVLWEGGKQTGDAGIPASPYAPGDMGARAADERFRGESNVSRQRTDNALTDEDDTTSSSSGGGGGSTWYPRRSSGGSYGGGGYSSGGGYGGGGGGNPYSHSAAMRSAPLHAGAMGVALRTSMGAPIATMPGFQGDEEDDYREPAFVPGGAGVDPYGVPAAATAPSSEGKFPPWPGAYQTRQAMTGASGGGGSAPAPAAPAAASAMGPYAAGRRAPPRLQPSLPRVQTAAPGFGRTQVNRGRGRPPARRGRR